MLEMQNAKEREAGDWEKLFNEADPGFKFLGIKQPPTARLGIIEAEWLGTKELKEPAFDVPESGFPQCDHREPACLDGPLSQGPSLELPELSLKQDSSVLLEALTCA